MAMAVVYTNFAGQIVSENRGGTVREYVPDTLGSTTALATAGGITDTWDYWPYGEVITRTGSTPTPFTFVGVLGYFKDLLDKLFYVRARHYQPNYGRWLTVDPFWPHELPYSYVSNAPPELVDPTGMSPACRCNGCNGSVLGGGTGTQLDCLKKACNRRCRRLCWADTYDSMCDGNPLKCATVNWAYPTCEPTDAHYEECHTSGGNGEGGQWGGSGCCVECGIRMCCTFTAGLRAIAEMEWKIAVKRCLSH